MRTAGEDDLEMTRLAPAAEAVSVSSAWAKEVNITILILGIMDRMIFAASKPFNTGIETSRIITSGSSCRAFSIPCCPFSASPHTRNSGKPSIRLRNVCLIAGWSSTINIRHGTQKPLISFSRIPSTASISKSLYYLEASAATGPSFSPGSGRCFRSALKPLRSRSVPPRTDNLNWERITKNFPSHLGFILKEVQSNGQSEHRSIPIVTRQWTIRSWVNSRHTRQWPRQFRQKRQAVA